jgi:multiple sugar transport system substrate-binding protein
MTRLRVVMEDIPDSHLVAQLTGVFQRDHPAIEVVVEAMHYDLMLDRMMAGIGDPAPPNGVVIFDNPWTHDWVRGGLIRPIDDLLEASPELNWDDFAPSLRAAARMDGKIWGVPFYTWSFGLIYRADLYEAHQLRPPRTLGELSQNAATLTTATRSGMAMQPRPDYNAAEEWANYLFAAGGSVQDETGTVVMDSPQARAALHAYADMYARCSPGSAADWSFEDSIAALAQGTAAQMINCHWWLPVLNDPDGPAGELAGRFKLAAVPGGTGVLGVWYWAITAAADPEQARAAWTFISWIASHRANAERVAAGGSPVRTSTMRDPEIWHRGYGRQYYETVQAMHESARPLMNGPNAEEATRVIGQAVHDVITGTRGADAAVSDAAAEVTDLLREGATT